jgi:membrane associated rhomboid family serine protease
LKQIRKKQIQTFVAAALLIVAIAGWIVLPSGPGRSLVFFVIGLLLLWGWSSAQGWRDLLRKPAGPEDEVTAEAVPDARALAVKQHEERLAAHTPHFTFGLLACITIASILQMFAGPGAVKVAGLVKPAARSGEWWRLLSSTYMHGGAGHFFLNFGALHAIGKALEAYVPRTRLPLVYLLSALGGSLASLLFLPNKTSVGASGAILGLGGYLLVTARRQAYEIPSWLGDWMLTFLGLTAYLGFFGYAFIDNAAHAGGAATGALIGWIASPRPGTSLSSARQRALDFLGWVAAVLLVAGALGTGVWLVRNR